MQWSRIWSGPAFDTSSPPLPLPPLPRFLPTNGTSPGLVPGFLCLLSVLGLPRPQLQPPALYLHPKLLLSIPDVQWTQQHLYISS